MSTLRQSAARAPEQRSAETEPATQEQPTSAFTGKFMVNVDEYLNIRAAADENSDVVGKLYAGAGGTVRENVDEMDFLSFLSFVY